MPKDLRLPLKKQWFDLTKAGIKTEDYREITPYWAYRLFNTVDKNGINKIKSKWFWHGFLSHSENNKRVFKFRDQKRIDYVLSQYGFKPFTTTTLTLGYPSATDTDKIITFEHLGIEIGYGKQEWGAEPNKLYFIIKHGKLL